MGGSSTPIRSATPSILPSNTIPGWSSIFTGKGPAYNGISGNEFFVRETMQFLAPIPVSVEETDDVRRAITEDLVGKVLKTQTLFDTMDGPAFVSLNYVHRGADLFTADAPSRLTALPAEDHLQLYIRETLDLFPLAIFFSPILTEPNSSSPIGRGPG